MGYGDIDREGVTTEYFEKSKEGEWKEEILRWACTKNAYERICRIKIVNIEIFNTIRDIVFRSYKIGKLAQSKIDDAFMKKVLIKVNMMSEEERVKNWLSTYARKVDD